ncbi:hypothetical protein KC19_5G094100 [Ceratodon purpureus]|uniref:Secreted protein n=1 Tax=Ceratodon purpureus TaxID=3225 RepID=A0A8T0HZM5_CERPU|nr:hypothetical protein KC19_5G094100 [Ceratodon purpureus]
MIFLTRFTVLSSCVLMEFFSMGGTTHSVLFYHGYDFKPQPVTTLCYISPYSRACFGTETRASMMSRGFIRQWMVP